MIPSGIEPETTFRFVAQHLNHCATAVLSQASNVRKYKNIKHGTLNCNVNISFKDLIPNYVNIKIANTCPAMKNARIKFVL